ncbi:MAG: MarR family transcriptional regulator [Clostridiales bacterium]|nr:MarR family transcriptional regulator [Clostridiales bacterium]
MVIIMKQHNEEEAILSLLELLPSYFQYFNNFTELKELQITKTQLRILLILSAVPSLSMSQLADKLCISREQATRAVAPLAERQLIFRNTHDTNRRQLDVSLSNSGIRLLTELKQEYRQRFTISLASLSEAERQTFIDSLHNIIDLMKKMTPSN